MSDNTSSTSNSLVCCSIVQERRRIFEEWAARNAKNELHQPKGTHWKYKSHQNLLNTNDQNDTEIKEECICETPPIIPIKPIPIIQVPPKPPRKFEISPNPLVIKTPIEDNLFENIDNKHVIVDESESIIETNELQFNQSSGQNIRIQSNEVTVDEVENEKFESVNINEFIDDGNEEQNEFESDNDEFDSTDDDSFADLEPQIGLKSSNFSEDIVEARNFIPIEHETFSESIIIDSEKDDKNYRESGVEADIDDDGAEDSFDDSFDETDDEHEEVPEEAPQPVATGKIMHIINEILTTEYDYINNLKEGLDNYYVIMIDKKLPIHLKGQKYTIFGVIKKIYEFQSDIFYPALLACKNDVAKIANTFQEYLVNGNFYLYVLYAMNKPRSESIVKKGAEFFKTRQLEIQDKLGVQSFLMQPIQRMPKYRLIISAMIKDLMKFANKEDSDVKHALAACCIAEKEIQILLDAANEVVSVNDIIVDVNTCYVNVAHQGKFLRVGEFNVHDHRSKRKYMSKVFLFTRAIVYTEVMNDKSLFCRGVYKQETMGIRLNEKKKNSFFLFTHKSGNEEIEFTNSSNNTDDWVGMITEMMAKIVQEEIRKLKQLKKRPPSYVASYFRMSTISDRTSGASSRTSSGSLTSGVWSSRSSHSSYESNEVSRTTWYVPRIT